MTRSTRSLWIACGFLLAGGAALAAEPPAKADAPVAAGVASANGEEICTDESVAAKQREAALRELGARLTALPADPGYRELNRTGLNYGGRTAPTPPPPAGK
jgi:hypothetical protein